MRRSPFIPLTLAACIVALGWLWLPRPERVTADLARPTAVVLWQPREPGVAVLAPPTASARRAWMREVSAVTLIASPIGLRLVEGARLRVPLPDGRVLGGAVRLVRAQAAGGEIAGGRLDDGGTFTLAHRAGQWTGVVLPKAGATVYRVFQADDGGTALASVPRESVLCASLPRGPRPTGGGAAGRVLAGASGLTQTVEPPLLNSRPEAGPVIFLDFDGATVHEPFWNGGEVIVAADSGLSPEGMLTIWQRVAADYAPFNINVTTDPARYAAARPMQRMRCIITSTSWYGDDVGGVAGIYSWPHAGIDLPYYDGEIPYVEDVPCWAFSSANFLLPDYIALAVSHEVGHTLGLLHDGAVDSGTSGLVAEYYQGHDFGATSWGPIMGAPYGRSLIQWSKGGYAGSASYTTEGSTTIFDGVANNNEDDVAIIASIVNHAGFAPERRAANVTDAGRLAVAADGVMVNHDGLIEVGGAESWLLLVAGAGPVELQLVAFDAADVDASNVDGALALADLEGNVIATADNVAGNFSALSTTLPAAGMYVLRVMSVGQGDPTDGGYSAYGSVGRFRVQGTVVAGSDVAPVIGGAPRSEGRAGESIRYAIEAAGMGLAYSAAGLPSGLTVGADGVVTGVPTQAGIFPVEVRATNVSGTVARTVTFAVAPDSLSQALDAPYLSFSTGGDRPWSTVAELDAPTGGSVARSGEVLDGYQLSWIETKLHGPGRLRWRWKVSSEENYDFYVSRIDDVTVAEISGDTGWVQVEADVPAGMHTVRWSYEKDPFFSDFQDAAWLDDVRWDRGFEFWAEAAVLVGRDAGPDADPDADGVPNLIEYAFARSPTVADGLGEKVRVEPSEDPAAERALEVVFDRPADRLDLRYVVEVSGDLLNWERGHAYGEGVNNTGELPTIEVSRAPLGDGIERICVRDTRAPGPAQGADRRFIRVRIERT